MRNGPVGLKDRRDFATDLRRVAAGRQIPDVTTTRHGYRRINGLWLAMLADHVDRLESALRTIVTAWESVPENVQVPDEINVDEMWDDARRVLDQ
jgi:hypothetical protein